MRTRQPFNRIRSVVARVTLAVALGVQPVAAAPALPAVETPAHWVRAGQPRDLVVHRIGGDMFIAIEHLARISESQIRWLSAANQVCLNNANGELCFDWESKAVSRDDRRLRQPVEMRFEGERLYVPIKFATSRDFESFSAASVTWNPDRLTLTQDPEVNLRIPQVERTDGVYRLTFDVNPKAPPQLIEKSGSRIWLRFSRAVTNGSQILVGDTVISEVHVTQRRRSADLQIHLGDDAAASEVFYQDGKRHLVVEVMPGPRALALMPPAIEPARTAAAAEPVKTAKASSAKPPAVAQIPGAVAVPAPAAAPKSILNVPPAREIDGVRTFVIDAGHGGVDSGAIGVRGTMEKSINLAVARNLAKQLSRIKGIRVIMTREKDVFIPLNQRTAMANAAGADLFVSIHCNSALSSKGNGFETYFLSADATDKAAEAVARVENSVVSLEVQKGSGSSRLSQLLASMAVYNFINESSKFAAIMCKKIQEKSNVDKASVKEADFFVLRGAQMPAVLVELEYLSNPVSELRLRSTRYQNQLVKGLVEGILAYDRQHRQEQEAYASQPRRDAGRRSR